LPLALGHHKMFDADGLAGEPIRPTRDIAGCEDARNARLEVFVHRDTAIDGKPRLFGQGESRPDTNADDHEIGRKLLTILQRDASRIDRSDGRAKTKCDAMFLMKFANELTDLSS